MALDFEDRDCRGVKLDRIEILVPKVTALRHGVCPPCKSPRTAPHLTQLPSNSTGRRTGPVHRQEVTRQNLNQFSRVTHTRERPVDTFTSSLLPPVRGVERELTSVKKDTNDRAHGAADLHPPGVPVAEVLEAQPPSSARTCVRTNSSPLCQNTSHRLTHSIPACTAGSTLWSKPAAMPDVTRLPDLGHTASAPRDLIPCMVEGAIPMPAAPKLDHGQVLVSVESGSFLGVTTDDSESFASFRGLARAFSHHTNSASCASSLCRLPGHGSFWRHQQWIPSSSSASSKQGFGLNVRATSGRLGRDDQAQSVTGKRDDFGRFHAFA